MVTVYAVVVRETGDAAAIDASGEHVETNVVPRTQQAPGIVAAYWTTDRAGRDVEPAPVRRGSGGARGDGADPRRAPATLHGINVSFAYLATKDRVVTATSDNDKVRELMAQM